MRNRVLAGLLVSATIFSSAASADVITFTDGDLSLSNYDAVFYLSGTVAGVISRSPDGGNPGSALFTQYAATGPFALVAGVYRTDYTYDPTVAGSVLSIDASLDRIAGRTIDGNFSNVATYSFRPLILQGGFFYQPSVSQIFTANSSWITMSLSGLVASDFGRWDTSTNLIDSSLSPDFSAPMTFGFISAFFGSQPGGTDETSQRGFTYNDNWVVRITTAGTVPEPGSLALLSLGLAGLAWMRRRRR